EKKAPRLGGGVVYAHLNHLPQGKYRVRIKADTDCLVDEVDISPAFVVGVGIVENTQPMGHYDHLYNSILAAFFDYTANISTGAPVTALPVGSGEANIT